MYFDRENIRLWLAAAWLITFAIMWYGFSAGLDDCNKTMISTLDRLENSVIQEDWKRASAEISLLKKKFRENETLIRITNSPEDLSTFLRELEEASILVKNQEDDVLTQIGGLKEEIRTITTVFQGI